MVGVSVTDQGYRSISFGKVAQGPHIRAVIHNIILCAVMLVSHARQCRRHYDRSGSMGASRRTTLCPLRRCYLSRIHVDVLRKAGVSDIDFLREVWDDPCGSGYGLGPNSVYEILLRGSLCTIRRILGHRARFLISMKIFNDVGCISYHI